MDNLRSLARMAAFVCLLLSLCGLDCYGEVTPREIVDVWMGRQKRIRTAKIVWSHRQIDKKHCMFGPGMPKDGTESRFPAEDTERERRCELYVDGPNMRIECEGLEWFFDDETGAELRMFKRIEVIKDGKSRTLNSTKEQGSWGTIDTVDPDMVQARTFPPLPAVWFLRPFFVHDVPTDPTSFRIVRTNDGDSTECVLVDRSVRLTFGSPEEFLLERYVSSGIELDVQYRQSEFGMVPDEWSSISSNQPDTVSSMMTCKVIELEINKTLPSDTFEIDFPPGTRVTKDDKIELVVSPNGDLVPGLLFAEDAGSTGKRWRLILTGVIVFSLVAMLLVKHRQSV